VFPPASFGWAVSAKGYRFEVLFDFLRKSRALYASARALTSAFVASPIWTWLSSREPPQPTRAVSGERMARRSQWRRLLHRDSVNSGLPMKREKRGRGETCGAPVSREIGAPQASRQRAKRVHILASEMGTSVGVSWPFA
jgi:hypothetical protein